MGQLQLHIAFLDPVGALGDQWIALPERDQAAALELRVVEVVPVPPD